MTSFISSSFTFLTPQWLWLLLLLPVWSLLFLFQLKQSRNDLQKFQNKKPHPTPLTGNAAGSLLAIMLLVMAMARPGWNPQVQAVEESGRDIIFLLDVSRSMLAADMAPDRITVARNSIRRTINSLPGHRFGLVVFAGTPLIVSPLTDDQLFLSHALEKFGPESVGMGGTHISGALMEVLNSMLGKNNGSSTDIILITDGEDLGEYPSEALELINDVGSRLLVIGLGDDQYGARIPGRKDKGWTMNNGREHWSRRDDKTLGALAQGAKYGIYFPVGTDYFDLTSIMEKVRRMWPEGHREQSNIVKYTEGYPWFLALAAILLISCLLRFRPGILAAGLLALSFNAKAQLPNISMLERQALVQYQDQQYSKATDIYRQIAYGVDYKTGNEELAITAHYNLATILILRVQKQLWEQKNSQKTDKTLNNEILDDGELLELLDEAQKIYRRILLTNPMHIPSARNLEWLTFMMKEQDKNSRQSKQKGKPSSDSQQRGQSSSRGGEANAGEEGGSFDISLDGLNLAPPSESANDILEQARAREEQRGLKWKKQQPVEQDW